MELLFQYNWRVRDEWFDWCGEIPYDELIRERVGGVGGILKTLFHIVDVEWSWIRALKGELVLDPEFEDYKSLELVRKLSEQYRLDVKRFLDGWSSDQEHRIVTPPWNPEKSYVHGEVLRHVIAHEIHHIGQLSVWAKEVGRPVVSANFIGRGIL
ncbi:DinB family protein [Paenibacillus alkalitolerans]|uniref:DinB family protein n=1 Tax=Paenibacillus alkalitolerans TaxID=2799335 RepID=UPI0018F52B8B|nr:DinB family protein [Paenibacillus alkalitolerans]